MRLVLLLSLSACFQFKDKDGTADAQETAVDSESGADSDSDSGETEETDSGETDETDTSPIESVVGIEILTPATTEAFDECGEVCFSVRVSADGAAFAGAIVDWEVRDHGFIATEVVAGEDGVAEACVPSLGVGTWEYTVIAYVGEGYDERGEEGGNFTIAPWGYDLGYDRKHTVLEAPPWVPTFARYAGNPLLVPNNTPEEPTCDLKADPDLPFDCKGPFVPTVAKGGNTWYMWYAAQQVDGGDYVLGAATSTDGYSWTELGMIDGVSEPTGNLDVDWNATATNSPMLLEHDGEWRLYFTGKRGDTSDLNIGLATSSEYGSGGSAVNVALLPPATEGGENPVFEHVDEEEDWGGEAVAHPSVLWNPDKGWYEMWYSTGLHRVGYAMSTDGISWERYCNNPVLLGDAVNEDGTTHWENGRVKSTEVAYHNGYYMMTFTGGDTGEFQLGWAMSKDGIHWAKAAEPVLGPDEASAWENSALQGGFLVVDGSMLRMWYGASFNQGAGFNGTTINYADASLPTSFE